VLNRMLLALLLLGLMTLTGISSCDPIFDPGGFCIDKGGECEFLAPCCAGLKCEMGICQRE